MMPNWLRQRTFLTPDRTAVEENDTSWTFRELDERVKDVSERLVYAGAAPGTRVAVLMKNSMATITVIHALTYIGATAVLLNTRLSKEELLWQIEDADASILLADGGFRYIFPDARAAAYTVDDLYQLPCAPYTIQEEWSGDEIATMIYTSGTTGKPKGVLLTYNNHWSSAVASALNLGLHEQDCWLACLPLFHVGGLSIVWKNVIYGMRVVLHSRFDAADINEAISAKNITMISVVSKMLSDMLQALGSHTYSGSLRCVLLGGGPAPKPLLETCAAKGIPVYQTYGMTETASQVCTLSSDYMLTKIGSAGKPLFSCQLRIEADGRTAPAHTPGEIVVKGPSVTPGYFKKETALQNGWLYTGDIGYLDEDGFLYVLDRRSDLIISGGENIYPAQIEEVLLSHPDVEEAGVVGKEEEAWGQVPVAFVKVMESSTVTEEELMAFCAEKLARYKVPKQIRFTSALPRNAAKKLLRRELRDML